MRRDRIIEAINRLREALIDSQVRDILRARRSSENAENANITQKLLMAYSIFSQHHINFGEEEKYIMTIFGLSPLVNVNFWSSLLDDDHSVSQKMLSDVEVGVYNVVYVMPKFKDLLLRHTDRTGFSIKLQDGLEREVHRLQIFIAERGDALTDTAVVTNVIRAVEEIYESFSYLHKNSYVALSIGGVDSGDSKSFDFFGTKEVIEDINEVMVDVWHKVKNSSKENMRYQIEVALMAAGFATRVTETQRAGGVTEEEGQRIIRAVSRGIESLFQNGAYTENMDRVEESRASAILQRQTAVLELDKRAENIISTELVGPSHDILLPANRSADDLEIAADKEMEVVESAAE